MERHQGVRVQISLQIFEGIGFRSINLSVPTNQKRHPEKYDLMQAQSATNFLDFVESYIVLLVKPTSSV